MECFDFYLIFFFFSLKNFKLMLKSSGNAQVFNLLCIKYLTSLNDYLTLKLNELKIQLE